MGERAEFLLASFLQFVMVATPLCALLILTIHPPLWLLWFLLAGFGCMLSMAGLALMDEGSGGDDDLGPPYDNWRKYSDGGHGCH